MKQITEDYCSFEIAKLLKEKGVDFIDCVTYYCEDKPKEVNYSFCGETNSTWEKRCCQAPTHQMTLKWLREVHDLHIIVYPWQADNEEKASHWCCTVYRAFAHLGNDVYTNETPKSYEEAVEAALKYTLENLI